MLAALLPLFFILTLIGFVARGSSTRKAFLSAAIVSGLLLAAMTELLSIVHAVRYASLAVCWGVAVCAAAVYCLLRRHDLREWRKRRADAGTADCLLLGAALAVVLLPTLLIAVVCPPNNLDSMAYHMSRVMHWIQNGSVAHYPTSGARQLYLSPWAEFAIMHLQILSGGDHLANLVQWFAMCGSIIGVTLIAQELGASGRVQACSAIIVATLPMGILQATSTQNDFVVSFWLVCFVYFGLLLLQEWRPAYAVAAGAALGLAILTKGTAYIFALPFVVWFACAGLKNRWRSAGKFVLTLALLVVALNSGHWMRNYRLWGNPLSTDKAKVGNEYLSPAVILTNLSRNVVYQTWTPFKQLNLLQYRMVERLHDSIRIGISDPRTTMFERPFEALRINTHEDFAGNGLHMLLFLLALPVLALRWRKLPQNALLLCLALVAGYFLFSGLIKWSVWGNRLQLPFFVLASPLLAVVFPFEQRRRLAYVVTAGLLLCSTPWIFKNHTRQLVGDWSILTLERERLYFTSRPKAGPYYLALVNSQLAKNNKCDTIAINSNEDAYEYPFWIMLRNRLGRMPRIEHVNVDNPSGSVPLRDFRPCATVNLY